MSRSRHQARFGLGKAVISTREAAEFKAESDFATQAAWMVKQKIDAKRFNPPLLPEVALALTQMANRKDVSIDEVEKTVKRDPAVAARVLGVANSAFYHRSSPVRSLRAAILKLGLSELRNIAFFIVAKTRIFRVPGYAERMRELITAAQGAGLIAQKVCRVLRFESELAYLCGLLHDIGEAIILGILGEQERAQGEPLPTMDDLRPVLEKYHGRAGAKVCQKWGLSEVICDAVMNHHHPRKTVNATQMTLVVHVTDRLLAHAAITQPQTKINPLEEESFYQLNCTPEQVTQLMDYALNLADNPDLLA